MGAQRDSIKEFDTLRRDDYVRDTHGDTWKVIQYHAPQGRREQAVTIQRQRDEWAMLYSSKQLRQDGFTVDTEERHN